MAENASENRHRGPALDSFLEEEGVLAEFQAEAIKEVIAWQLAEAMREQGSASRAWQCLCTPAGHRLTGCLIPATGM